MYFHTGLNSALNVLRVLTQSPDGVMWGADTQIIDGILKDYYEDFVSEQLNQRNPLKDLFKFEEVPFAGREVVYSAHVARNVSPMFVGEDGAFADAGAQQHLQIRVGQKKLMARIRMTAESIADSLKSEGAFKQAKKDEMDGLIKDIARREEAALCLDGRGILCFINGAPSGSTVTVDTPGGITNASFGNRFVIRGMVVGAVNPATGVLRSGVAQVTAVAAGGTTFTTSGAVPGAWADNDYIVQVANTSVTDVLDSSYEKAFWGLLALVDDGTYRNNYFGADRSQYSQFASYVKASTGALSLDLLQQVSDIVDQKLGGRIDLIVCHHSTRRLYLQLLEADRRYTSEVLKRPDGGTVAFQQEDLTMGEVPIKAIRDFALDVIALLDKKDGGWVQYTSEKGKWVDEDGAVLTRVGIGSTARDAFEAWYRIRKQYHSRYPGYSARLDGVTGQSLVVVRAE